MNSKTKIILFKTSSSGSNTYFLYRNFPEALKDKYEVRLATFKELQSDKTVADNDVFITTHGEYPSKPDKINIELWHGFPLKGMNNMDQEDNNPFNYTLEYTKHLDLIPSYSGLYNTLWSACMGANVKKYAVTGMPRNDALFNENSRALLQKIFPEINHKKTLFFMPTFRKSALKSDMVEGNKNFSNVFGFDTFDLVEMVKFLKGNDLGLVIKLHPFEERYFIKQLEEMQQDCIHLLTDSLLQKHQLDLYEVLGAADQLITDYSSVYFDYLLLNRPILFVPTDLEAYQTNRGMLLQPYDFWAPGPQAFTQHQLQLAIADFLSNPRHYEEQRNMILNLTHKHKDNLASRRIWAEIDRVVNAKKEMEREQEENKQIAASIKKTISQMIERGELATAADALKELEEAIRPDAEVICMRAILALMNGQVDQAINILNAGDRAFPNHPDLVYNLAYCYETSGSTHSAVHHYQRLLKISTDPELLGTVRNQLTKLIQASGGTSI